MAKHPRASARRKPSAWPHGILYPLDTMCEWAGIGLPTAKAISAYDMPLPYRSLQFDHQTFDTPQYQPVAVVNYPNDQPYTRVTEYKHLTGQRHAKTSVTFEYSRSQGDPYYPIPRPENAAVYARYKAEADRLTDVQFVGRLATYKYYNMDQVVAQALTTYAKIKGASAWTEVA